MEKWQYEEAQYGPVQCPAVKRLFLFFLYIYIFYLSAVDLNINIALQYFGEL